MMVMAQPQGEVPVQGPNWDFGDLQLSLSYGGWGAVSPALRRMVLRSDACRRRGSIEHELLS
jgi:hypothetical protein